MFALRGIAVSFSVFLLVYCGLSLAVGCVWRQVWLYSRRCPVRRSADLLFALRMFPLVAATAVTAAFTVPSFLLLEPRSIDEPLGGIPLALGIGGFLLMGFGVVNAALAVMRASRRIATWLDEAKLVDASGAVPVLRIARVGPALTAAGILRPKVLVSGAAEFVLTQKEFDTALRHELAHVRRRDNLKKLALRLVAFPGMAGLENAWLDATEMAADDAAVFSSAEALDLAAALIKLSRLAPHAPAELTMALVQSPAASVNARVERLIGWGEERRVPAHEFSVWYAICAMSMMVAACAVTYSALLVRVHTATEWLVR
jgi:beta-lactamase regulating signal transducer with metallopeptidase domain